ncbi:MAG: FAD-dependent 5-carboxymethylaminomethyl-2-thiouridine(34) oxidoreductase MnmC [Paraperlucidibaca sp.]
MTEHVVIVGAGIAGASCAWTLARRGYRVTVLDAGSEPGLGGSGNALAIVYPKLVNAALTPSHLQSLAYLHTLALLKEPTLAAHFQQTGVLWLDQPRSLRDVDATHPWWQKQVWRLSAEAASEQAGVYLAQSALWLPEAGVIRTHGLLRTLLSHANIRTVFNARVATAQAHDSHWRISSTQGLFSADSLVLAYAGESPIALTDGLALRPVRGQISQCRSSLPLRTTLCYGGYLTPADGGYHCIGATFSPQDRQTDVRAEDNAYNAQALAQVAPAIAASLPPLASWRARASLRWQTPDFSPMAGRHDPTLLSALTAYPPRRHRPSLAQAEQPPLFVSIGHGAKGYTQAWVAAEIIASQLAGTPSPWSESIAEQLAPDRFIWRDWQRGRLWTPRRARS